MSRAATVPNLGAVRTASAGIAMVGCSFGMARYGYGLLLPGFRASYHLGPTALGLISAGGYVAYLAATALAAVLAPRAGTRALVIGGGACAATGMATAGLTHSPAGLACGVLVGGASAGLILPPFSDLVAVAVAPERRERTFAAVSSGTGWGVAVAAPVAIASGTAWRTAWLVWAALALAATAWAARAVPTYRPGVTTLPRLRLSWFVCPRSGPLLVGSLLVGLGASVFWTFAVELLSTSGGLRPAAAQGFLLLVGVASVAGTAAGDVTRRFGTDRALGASAAALAASLLALGLAPASPLAAVAAGAGFGAAYNAVVTVQALWSGEVFAQRPSAGLAAVMTMLGLGLAVGPPLAGVAAGAIGLRGAFVVAGALVGLSALLRPRPEDRAVVSRARVAPAAER